MTTRTQLPASRTDPVARRRSTALEVARGVAAAIALVVFVAGVPLALAHLPSWLPLHLPDAGVGELLSRRDDGSLFLLVLLAIGWLAWAAFSASVVVEVVAVVRVLPVPRLPGLGLSQWAAGALVAATAVLIMPAQSFASPLPSPVAGTRIDTDLAASGAAATVPARDAESQRAPTSHQAHVAHMAHIAHQARTGGLPTVIVGRYDTLWGLADRHLGDGTRYQEIFELNRGLAQNDGATLRDPDVIHPGWMLRLPADARDLPTRQTTQARAPVGEPATAGGKEVEPMAPQRTEAPEVTHRPAPVETTGPHDEPTPASDAPAVSPWAPSTSPESTTTPSAVSSTPITPSPVPIRPEAPASSESSSPPAVEVAAADQPNDDHQDPGRPASMLVAGLTAMTLTGMVGELARRRRRQRARRRIGERVPIPTGDDARFEAVAASVAVPVTADVLRRALRHVAAGCEQQDRLLPDVRLLLIGPDSLDVHLGAPEDSALCPFTSLSPERWRLEPSSPLLGEDAAYGADPYPNLLALGAIGDQQALLNLDSVGAVHLGGDPEQVADVQRALAVDLAIGPLSGWAFPVFVDCFHDLATVLDPTRVTLETDAQVVASMIAQRVHGNAGQARPSLHLDADPTYLALSVEPLDAEPEPYSGVVIVDVKEAARGGAHLTLTADGSARLTPGDLTLDPQRLSPNDYQRIVSLLAVGLRDPVAPAGDCRDDSDGFTAAHAAIPAVDVEPKAGKRPLDMPGEPTWDSAADEATAAETLATPDEEPEVVEAPRVLLLGQVDVERCAGTGSPESKRRTTELIAFLALNPASTGHAIDEALWPGQRVDRRTRNTTVTRARLRLGKGPEGVAYLPTLEGPDARYGLHPDVTCDWRDFEALALRGTEAGPAGLPDLDAALELVRGRPFSGIDPGSYVWAEPVITRMIDTVVDIACLAAGTHLANGDPRKALHAALTGLTVDDSSDILYDVAERSARAARDGQALARIQTRRARIDDPDQW